MRKTLILTLLLLATLIPVSAQATHRGIRHRNAKTNVAKHLSGLERVKRQYAHASAQAAKIPLAQRRRIYYDLTAADHNAVLAMDRRHTPAEQDALMLAVTEREHARVRRRWHIPDDTMTAIGTEGYEKDWPRVPLH